MRMEKTDITKSLTVLFRIFTFFELSVMFLCAFIGKANQ